MVFCRSCLPKESSDLESWKSAVVKGLQRLPTSSREFRRSLLLLEGINELDNNNNSKANFSMTDDFSLPFRGYPRRPLYMELAWRLCSWYETTGSATTTIGAPLLLPAEALLFQEHPITMSIEPPARSQVGEWLALIGEAGILHMLGMRHTVGTHDGHLLPPPRSELLHAANQPHSKSSTLTVAARARAKHAHRAGGTTTSFFGVAKGTRQQQNDDALSIVKRLLDEAVWINIHTFAGTDGNPVLEVREEHGYGARWVGSIDDECGGRVLGQVEFRGFLEPQMIDGHERRWRH